MNILNYILIHGMIILNYYNNNYILLYKLYKAVLYVYSVYNV